MSAIHWIVWGASIFTVSGLWTFLDPVVDELLNTTEMSFLSLNFVQWGWNYGVLLAGILIPTIWVLMKYQKSEYGRVSR